jgi:hypothetical protein
MPRREPRETNPGPRTLRAGDSCLHVRQDTLQAEDSLQGLGADPDMDIEQASEVTVRNSGIRRWAGTFCTHRLHTRPRSPAGGECSWNVLPAPWSTCGSRINCAPCVGTLSPDAGRATGGPMDDP